MPFVKLSQFMDGLLCNRLDDLLILCRFILLYLHYYPLLVVNGLVHLCFAVLLCWQLFCVFVLLPINDLFASLVDEFELFVVSGLFIVNFYLFWLLYLYLLVEWFLEFGVLLLIVTLICLDLFWIVSFNYLSLDL